MKTIKLILMLALFPVFALASEDIGGGQEWPEFTHINVDTLVVWKVLDLTTYSVTPLLGNIAPDSIYVRSQHVAVSLLMDSAYISVDSIDTQHLVVDVGMTSAGYASVDSVDTQHLVVDVDATADSINTQHLVADIAAELTAGAYLADDDSLLVYTDKYVFYIKQTPGAAGDRDMSIVLIEEDGTEHEIKYNEGTNTWQFDDPVFINDILKVSTLIESGQATLTFDPENAGQGTGEIGLPGDLDIIDINSNLITVGDHTTGVANIVTQADTGGTAFTIRQWDETDDQLEFPVPVQVAELDVVEAGDAISLGAYTRHINIMAGSAVLGPTAPSWSGTAGNTVYGLAFDANAEVVGLNWHVPTDWDGASDMVLHIHWCAQSGDAPLNGETVIWKAGYRSIVWGTEDIDNGTVVTITDTYTEAGDPGDDADSQEMQITIDHDDGNQPLTAGDLVCMAFYCDVDTDTYSGDGIVPQWEIHYTSTGIPTHN